MNNNNLTPKGWGNKQGSPDKWRNSANTENARGSSPWSNNDKSKNFFSQESSNKTKDLVDSAKERGTAFADQVSEKAQKVSGNATAALSGLRSKAADSINNKKQKLHESENMAEEMIESVSNTESSEIKKTVAPNWARQTIEHSESASTSRLETGSSSPKNTQFKEIDSGFNTSYVIESQKRSPKVYILCGAIGALLLGLGVFGGMKLMKNKDSNNNFTTPAAESVSSTTVSATNNVPVTTTVAKQTEAATTAVITTAMQKILKEYPASDISNYPQYINAIKESTTTYFYNPDIADYALLDLNNDNVPELFLNGANGYGLYCVDAASCHALFSSMGGNRPPSLSFTDKGYIIISYMPNASGEGSTSYCIYEGGNELKNVYNIQYDLANETRQHDNTFLTEEEYLQEIAKFGNQITLNSTPVKSISEVKSYIDTQAKPTAEAYIEEKSAYPIGNGSSFILNVTGNYAYYYYEGYYTGGGKHDDLCISGTTSEASVKITAGSVQNQVRAVVTPYNSDGVPGETIYLSMTPKYSDAYSSQTITACTKYGEIYSPRGVLINGYTKSFIVDDSKDYSLVRNDLMDKWHVTAVNYFIRCGTYWYELYDTDDGDYYGWVNENNITFY